MSIENLIGWIYLLAGPAAWCLFLLGIFKGRDHYNQWIVTIDDVVPRQFLRQQQPNQPGQQPGNNPGRQSSPGSTSPSMGSPSSSSPSMGTPRPNSP